MTTPNREVRVDVVGEVDSNLQRELDRFNRTVGDVDDSADDLNRELRETDTAFENVQQSARNTEAELDNSSFGIDGIQDAAGALGEGPEGLIGLLRQGGPVAAIAGGAIAAGMAVAVAELERTNQALENALAQIEELQNLSTEFGLPEEVLSSYQTLATHLGLARDGVADFLAEQVSLQGSQEAVISDLETIRGLREADLETRREALNIAAVAALQRDGTELTPEDRNRILFSEGVDFQREVALRLFGDETQALRGISFTQALDRQGRTGPIADIFAQAQGLSAQEINTLIDLQRQEQLRQDAEIRRSLSDDTVALRALGQAEQTRRLQAGGLEAVSTNAIFEATIGNALRVFGTTLEEDIGRRTLEDIQAGRRDLSDLDVSPAVINQLNITLDGNDIGYSVTERQDAEAFETRN